MKKMKLPVGFAFSKDSDARDSMLGAEFGRDCFLDTLSSSTVHGQRTLVCNSRQRCTSN
jgi:hypothetical protein